MKSEVATCSFEIAAARLLEALWRSGCNNGGPDGGRC
jgi:hypothetical protein